MATPSPARSASFVRLAAHPMRWRLLCELAASDYRVRELVERVAQPQNLVSYHLRLLRTGGLVTAGRSSFDARDSYYHLDLDRCAQALVDTGLSLHPALHLDPAPPAAMTIALANPPTVLFTCTGNSARSPIAEALLRHHTAGLIQVTSAGSHPKPHIHPYAVRVLREHYDIEMARRHPRHLDTMTGRRFDYVISLCDRVREVCPDFPGHPRRVHWSIPDPADDTGQADSAIDRLAFEHVAAEINTRIRHLLPVLTRTPDQKGGTQP